MTSCPWRNLVDRHFAAAISPRAERALRIHLPGCAICHQHYERYLILTAIDRGMPSMKDRLARGLGLPPQRRAWSRLVTISVGVAAALVALWLRGPAQPAYVARGSAAVEDDVALYVYRIPPGGTPRPIVNGVIGSRDELAFAYVNRTGWSRLLVFTVDDSRRVYWYHPAWTDPTSAPVALRIDTGPERVELPEAIAQPLPRGRLELHAVFTDDAMTVQAIERGARPLRARELIIPIEVREPESP